MFRCLLPSILVPILTPYYYRYTFDNAISEGKYEKLEPLISSSEFIDYATPEQGRKVLEFVIEHNNYDIDKKLALFDYSSFNKFGNIEMSSKIVDSILEIAIKRDNATKFSILAKSKVISYLSHEQFQKLVNSILDNITIDDNNSRYRLLENQIIEPFWDKTQAQNLLKTIVDHTDSNSINEMYDLLDQPCFKRYATEELAESVVASMSKLIKKSYTYEKIQFLTHNYTKQYITSEDRRAIVESFVDSGLPTDNSSLNKLFFEICSQQELENICNKIKKQNIDFPESFVPDENYVEQPTDNTKSYVSYNNDNSNKMIGIITAKSGINIRKEPKANSQKIGSIENNTEVTILDINGPKQTIENISSNWYKVTDGKVSGWCFGGFVNVVDSNDNDYSKTLDNTIPSNRRVSEITNNITYKKYSNVKYGYSINYPDFMIPNGESDSGDGQKFYFDKETYIAVWASFNMDGIEKEYNSTKETTDSYSVLKKTWFIRSGTDSTNHVYYRKTILDNEGFYTYTMYFYYPSESKTKFDKIINDVTKSIKVSLFKNAR